MWGMASTSKRRSRDASFKGRASALTFAPLNDNWVIALIPAAPRKIFWNGEARAAVLIRDANIAVRGAGRAPHSIMEDAAGGVTDITDTAAAVG